ncbi:MAG: hypothetical protein ACYTJ0_09125 [Planctomycetota bacterium]|jgi:mono/diheme cytochrome c family protein
MWRPHFVGSLLAACLVIGCATIEQIAPPVDEAMLAAAGAEPDPLSMLRHGRELYITKCARCHSPEPVTAYSRAQWNEILPRMSDETGLSLDERRALEAYIRAVLTSHGRLPQRDVAVPGG